ADAGGEYDGVGSAEDHAERADEAGDAVGVDVEGEFAEVVAFLDALDDVAHGGAAVDAFESALFVERTFDFFDGHAEILVHEDGEVGVDVAAAGAHDDAAERGEPHGGFDGMAAVDGGDAAPVAEVAGDDFEQLFALAENPRRFLGD